MIIVIAILVLVLVVIALNSALQQAGITDHLGDELGGEYEDIDID